MRTHMPNIISLLEKHQYTIRAHINKKSVVIHFPEKYLQPHCENSVIKYRVLDNPSRVRITYQTLGKPRRGETIRLPRYACVLYICFHMTIICTTIYDYATPLVQFFFKKHKKTDFLQFWAKYLNIINLSPEDTNKHAELSLLCGLAQKQNFSPSFSEQAEKLDILDGYEIIKKLMGHETIEKITPTEKKRSWKSFFKSKRG